MGETVEIFRAMKKHEKEERRKRREEQRADIRALEREGFTIEQFKQNSVAEVFHIRVDKRLDLYLSNKRWHDLMTGDRGEYEDQGLAEFVREFFDNLSPLE